MKINEITESSLFLNKIKDYAKAHYSDAADETEAVLLLFAKSLKHAEEDDRRQDSDIDQLKQEIEQLKRTT